MREEVHSNVVSTKATFYTREDVQGRHAPPFLPSCARLRLARRSQRSREGSTETYEGGDVQHHDERSESKKNNLAEHRGSPERNWAQWKVSRSGGKKENETLARRMRRQWLGWSAVEEWTAATRLQPVLNSRASTQTPLLLVAVGAKTLLGERKGRGGAKGEDLPDLRERGRRRLHRLQGTSLRQLSVLLGLGCSFFGSYQSFKTRTSSMLRICMGNTSTSGDW